MRMCPVPRHQRATLAARLTDANTRAQSLPIELAQMQLQAFRLNFEVSPKDRHQACGTIGRLIWRLSREPSANKRRRLAKALLNGAFRFAMSTQGTFIERAADFAPGRRWSALETAARGPLDGHRWHWDRGHRFPSSPPRTTATSSCTEQRASLQRCLRRRSRARGGLQYPRSSQSLRRRSHATGLQDNPRLAAHDPVRLASRLR